MEKETISIVVSDIETRGSFRRELDVEELSKNITSFLGKINTILENSPEQVGNFRFTEFEISAEVTAKGTLSILGTGGEAAGKAGLKFKFHRT